MYECGGIACLCALFSLKVVRERKRMSGCLLLAYVLVLVLDLLVGGAVVLWKCSFSTEDNEEGCALAIGGTLGSLIIWLLFMLVCPCCITKIEIAVTLENIRKKCVQYSEKIRPPKMREINIQKGSYDHTSTPLVNKGQGLGIANGDVQKRQRENVSTAESATWEKESHPQAVLYLFNEINKVTGKEQDVS